MDNKSFKQSFIGPSGRVFKRSNATPKCRRQTVLDCGKSIALVGVHGFEWSVVETENYKDVKVTSFSSRKEALDFYNLIIKTNKNIRCR